MRSRLAAICGLLVPVAFTFSWLVGGFAQPAAYDWTRHEISDLGAMTANQPWLYNQLGANLTGMLLFVFAVGLWRELGLRLARVGVGLLAIAGIGQFLDGFLRLDCRAIDAGCGLQPVSWHAVAHVVESLVTLFSLAVAPFVLARSMDRMPGWADLLRPTLLSGVAAIATFVGMTILVPGIGSRAAATIWFAWVALLAYRLLHLQRGLVA